MKTTNSHIEHYLQMTPEEKRVTFCADMLDAATDPAHPWHGRFDWTDTPQAAAIRLMQMEEHMAAAGCYIADGHYMIPDAVCDLLDFAYMRDVKRKGMN